MNNTDPSNPFIGAWELVSGSAVNADQSVTDYTEAGLESIKVLSGNRFSFITSAKGAFYAAGAGEYSVGNGTYAEMPALASHDVMLGQRYEFQYEFDGDTWINARWQDGKRVEFEVWKRIR